MRFKLTFPACRIWLASAFLLLMFSGEVVKAKDLKFEALLVWATNSKSSPDPKHKPVEEGVRRKLAELPLKWQDYYEVRRVKLSVPSGGSCEASLSDECKIQVTDVDGKHVEVSLVGKGQPVLKRTQPLPKGEMLVLGGNAPDSTGWLVVLKRIE